MGASSSVNARDQGGSGKGVTWSRTYAQVNGIDTFQTTTDGGFVIAGQSFGPWIMKANSAGEPEWAGHYSPAGYISYLSSPSSVRQTSDGGYVLAGAAYSLSNFHGWVLKLDHEGSVQWSKTYGGPGSDYFSTKSQTKDGGYILTGNTESFGSSFHSSNG